MLSNYHKNQQDKLLFAISKTIKYMMIISTLISILIFLYADLIINLLFGEKFIISAECLKILIWMFIPYCGYIITMYYLNARGDVKYVMKVSILGLVLNILLNYYLIPAYSLKGAAIATLITEIIVFIGLMLKAIKEYNAVNSGHFIIKLSFITLSGLYFALYLPYYYIGLFFICYFTLLIYLLHIIDSEERYALKFIFKLFIDKFRRV
jgi:O-antigen/teichoic acid export membrane protein